MARIFQKLDLYPVVTGGSQLQWQLHPLFQAPTPYTFQVQWSRSGVQESTDWRNVGDPITGSGSATVFTRTDPNQRVWSTPDRYWYRVQLTDANADVYYSEPIFMFGTPRRDHRVMIAEILRKENLRLKYVGSCGQLYKRKYWGEPCDFTGCLDHDTGEATNSYCPTCYGTGWKGGYYKPTQYTLDFGEAVPDKIKTMEGAGLSNQMIGRGRGTPCPMPQTLDLWVADDDSRWLIDSVANVSSIAGFPVILSLTLRRAQPSDVVYAITPDNVG